MIFTGEFTRVVAAFTMSPEDAIQELDIKGTGSVEGDRKLLKKLMHRHHPDVATNKDSIKKMQAINVLMETYIRQNKPLPVITFESQPEDFERGFFSDSSGIPSGVGRRDVMVIRWWQRYIRQLSVSPSFNLTREKIGEINNLIERVRSGGVVNQVLDLLYDLHDRFIYPMEVIEGNAVLRKNGMLIKDAYNLIDLYGKLEYLVSELRNLWGNYKKNGGDLEDISDQSIEMLGALRELEDSVENEVKNMDAVYRKGVRSDYW